MGLPFEIPPILLQGDPGMGKTYFVSEFAKLVDLPFKELSMATMTASFVLSGGNLQWGEGSPGEIAKLMAQSPCANPIVLLDELDKISSDQKYNAVNALYGLLEPHSAKRFRDEALEIELDVSHVIWIGTGNYMRNIPEPIQSRMRIFVIQQPDPVDMQSVVRSIYLSIREAKGYGKFVDEHLDQEVVEALCHLSPRAVKLMFEESFFKVIREYRSELRIFDLGFKRKEAHRVGFT
jgi:ATP-dependent Lon protease